MQQNSTEERSENLLTVTEVAEKLKQHPESIRRACRAGRLPHIKLGTRIYIAREAVSAPVRTQEATP